jgi:hypothetical protein
MKQNEKILSLDFVQDNKIAESDKTVLKNPDSKFCNYFYFYWFIINMIYKVILCVRMIFVLLFPPSHSSMSETEFCLCMTMWQTVDSFKILCYI